MVNIRGCFTRAGKTPFKLFPFKVRLWNRFHRNPPKYPYIEYYNNQHRMFKWAPRIVVFIRSHAVDVALEDDLVDEARISRMESDVSHMRSDIADLKTDVREMRKDIAALKGDGAALRGEINTVCGACVMRCTRASRTCAAR